MNNKRGRGGFTLVELIVVLVILAILAALLIPALTGYIDKSKKSQVIAETRMLHQAIQTELSDYYGSSQWGNWGTLTGGIIKPIASNRPGSNSDLTERYNKIVALAEITSLEGTSPSGSFFAYFNESGKSSVIAYKDGQGKIGVYFGDTGETIAYDESELPGFNDYASTIMGTVSFAPSVDNRNDPVPYYTKSFLLTNAWNYIGS